MARKGNRPPDPKSRRERLRTALQFPEFVLREQNNRSFYKFLQHFWPQVSSDEFQPNWHIELMCNELQELAERVSRKEPAEYDLIINVPPGSTKTVTCSIMFPVWCWTRWYWMRFITVSYSAMLSLESADYSRELVRSVQFRSMYPELSIKQDKDTKGNFRIVKEVRNGEMLLGGNRFSTSVGGTLTGFHGHILIVDDPLNPQQAISETELKNCNHWLGQTLTTRKTDKAVTPTVLIQQRLHQNDPTGYKLASGKAHIRHICLPGEIKKYKEEVRPQRLVHFYTEDGLLDPKRMPWQVLSNMEEELGQYGYSGQVGQKPVPPGGGMFQVDMFIIMDSVSHLIMDHDVKGCVRYWDKAGTEGGGAWTAGVKMLRTHDGKYIILDVKRFQKASHEREALIRATAEADGAQVKVYLEQEPGSGGKESVESSIRNLAGFIVEADRPTGDKVFRADPYSVQVNRGNVILLRGDWNHEFIEEHRFFPFSTYKDQVDAASGAFSKLASTRVVHIS